MGSKLEISMFDDDESLSHEPSSSRLMKHVGMRLNSSFIVGNYGIELCFVNLAWRGDYR